MTKPIQKIMLVTNEPCDTAGAEQTALNFAKVFDAEVLLVDSIKTPFIASRIPSLSTELMYETAVAAKKAYLKSLQNRFTDAGVESSTKVLIGPRTSSELISTVVEEECDLVIRYMKGKSSRSAGRYGETAENLMRACPVPVLITEQPIANPKVVACINLDHGPEENESILESARQLVASPDDLSVVSCWQYSGPDFIFDYMDEGLLDQTREESEKTFAKMSVQLRSGYDLEGLGDRVQLINANPITAIPEFCSKNDINIAVMCSASLNHPLGRKLGSTIERTIGSLPCALLTVKPIGFASEASISGEGSVGQSEPFSNYV